MASWYDRRRSTGLVVSSAWGYGGPTSHDSSLTAAAMQVARKKVKRGKDKHDTWQEEAWSMYDQVGELQYVSNAIAGRMGQAELYVAKDGVRMDGDDPILELITGQMIERLGLNIFVAGSAWLAGLPLDDEKTKDVVDDDAITPQNVTANPETGKQSVWLVLSALEVKRSGKGKSAKVEIRGEKYVEDDIYLERIWDPHPAHWEEADSPVRSALPVLRTLVGLTQHTSAQIDSRLAGAGLYWIPNSILQSAKPAEEQETTFSENPVLNAIMTAMLLPMEDRSNASSVVPLLMGAPDESIAKIRYDNFSTPFDKNTGDLQDRQIRRLGLALDAPPELLQGMGDANHWGMWLVRDEVIQAHVKPRLDLICDALTTGFYRPIKKQQGDADPSAYEVLADVSKLVQRPNRLSDASQLHTVGTISDKTLRDAGGFEETDAPSSKDTAIRLALQVATANPQLLDNLPEIVTAIVAVLDGTPQTGPATISSQRQPGTLTPLQPGSTPVITKAPAAQNGQAVKPLGEADTLPRAGSPVG